MTLSRLHHALRMAAVTQIRYDTEGRVHYDREVAEGKTMKEARRTLKGRISGAVYRHLLPTDARGYPEGCGAETTDVGIRLIDQRAPMSRFSTPRTTGIMCG
jgi:hypothetical protein